MGASYWARWTYNGQVKDLASLVLPHVLAEGYDLLGSEEDRQVFDRGGMMRKIAWSLNGGRWSDAPTDLTIRYATTSSGTVMNFYWTLGVRPFPTTWKSRLAFERYLQGQMQRIVARLGRQLEMMDEPVAEEGAFLPSEWQDALAGETQQGREVYQADAVTAVKSLRRRAMVQFASACAEQSPECDVCHRPATPIPGAAGRHYCLVCRRHITDR